MARWFVLNLDKTGESVLELKTNLKFGVVWYIIKIWGMKLAAFLRKKIK
jgi:hypothetical protein